ncbi:hypothetical protein CQ056_14735 [Peribacillus simplex]|nr:hypothetical protein CQ056_14735 [Peribacillus simplex]
MLSHQPLWFRSGRIQSLIENSILPQGKNDINMPMVLQEGIIAGQYGPCLVKRRDGFSKWSEFTDSLAFRGQLPGF